MKLLTGTLLMFFSMNAFASSYIIMKVGDVSPFAESEGIAQAYDQAIKVAKEECQNNGGVLGKVAKIRHYDPIVAGLCVLKD